MKLMPTRECPVARGMVCKKGLAALNDLRHPERLTDPLLRKNGQLVPVSWAEALAYVRDALTPLLDSNPAAVGVFGSGSLTNKKTYLLGKFAPLALKTPNIDYNGRYCMASASAALNRTVDYDRGPGFPLGDMAGSDLILLVGADIAVTLPPIMHYLKAAKDRGGVVYSIDPRATVTARAGAAGCVCRPVGPPRPDHRRLYQQHDLPAGAGTAAEVRLKC
nr:molybdopterin-dependent oxidoreductase [Deinococcus sp. AJ005]